MGELIRYRVFDGKRMWYPEDFAGKPMAQCFLGMDGSAWTLANQFMESYTVNPADDAIAMLSTGLRDKHGKEVWVGDIVSFDPERDGELVEAEVLLWPGRFMLWCMPEYVHEIGAVERGEVVGNVHE